MSHPHGIPMSSFTICDKPVFIIGSPRSGTSVLAWSLGHHPSFWASQETGFLEHLYTDEAVQRTYEASTFGETPWLFEFGIDRPEFFEYMGLGVNALLTSRSGGRRWIDQTPGYTFMLDTIILLFPGARFLHIVRDGRAVVRSMLNFMPEVVENAPSWSRNFDDAVLTWRDFVYAALDFERRYPDRTLRVTNEDLSDDAWPEFEKILEFLEEPPSDRPANFFSTSRINSSFTSLVWGSDDRDAAERQDAAARLPSTRNDGEEAWKAWSEEERSYFMSFAGELFESLGYGTPSASPRPTG
jgi:Sulfotransferase family